MVNITNNEIAGKWLSVFAPGVPENLIQKYVIEFGNHLWHIFSWELVPCLEGDEAWETLGNQPRGRVIMFKSGYSIDGGPQIEDLRTVSSDELPGILKGLIPWEDVYFVDENFQWTYVKTHEITCGPYFARAAREI